MRSDDPSPSQPSSLLLSEGIVVLFLLFVDWSGISWILSFYRKHILCLGFGRVKASSLSFQLGKQTKNKLGFVSKNTFKQLHVK